MIVGLPKKLGIEFQAEDSATNNDNLESRISNL